MDLLLHFAPLRTSQIWHFCEAFSCPAFSNPKTVLQMNMPPSAETWDARTRYKMLWITWFQRWWMTNSKKVYQGWYGKNSTLIYVCKHLFLCAADPTCFAFHLQRLESQGFFWLDSSMFIMFLHNSGEVLDAAAALCKVREALDQERIFWTWLLIGCADLVGGSTRQLKLQKMAKVWGWEKCSAKCWLMMGA